MSGFAERVIRPVDRPDGSAGDFVPVRPKLKPDPVRINLVPLLLALLLSVFAVRFAYGVYLQHSKHPEKAKSHLKVMRRAARYAVNPVLQLWRCVIP